MNDIIHRYFSYVRRFSLSAGASSIVNFQATNDFYCFDMAGLPDSASIELVTIDVDFTFKGDRLSNIAIPGPLVATPSPGDSSWLFPFFIPKNAVWSMTVKNNHTSSFDFDLAFTGFHRTEGLPLEGCPPPKMIYYYVFDFGTVTASSSGNLESIEILSNRNFVALGSVATPKAVANDTLEFKVYNNSKQIEWSEDFIMGPAMWFNPQDTPRRRHFRIPVLMRAGESWSIECNNLTGSNQAATAIAFYGYHVPPDYTESDMMQDVNEVMADVNR